MEKEERKITNEDILTALYGEMNDIDLSKEPLQRMVQFISRGKDPTTYYMDDYRVELEWRDTEKTIQNCIQDFFSIA